MKREIRLLREKRHGCAFCSATGEMPRGCTCPVCKGKGRISLKPPVVSCAHCRGRGAEQPRTKITCTACGGRGYREVIEPVALCPSCGGRGAEQSSGLPCLACRGAGVRTS